MPGRLDVRSWAVSIHPIWITLLYLLAMASNLGSLTGDGFRGFSLYSGLAFMLISVLWIGWLFCLFSLAREKLAGRAALAGRGEGLAFVVAIIACLALGVGFVLISLGYTSRWIIELLRAATVVGAISSIACIWHAARYLVLVEGGAAKVSWDRVVGTFLLMLYLFVGIWFLHGRIRTALLNG